MSENVVLEVESVTLVTRHSKVHNVAALLEVAVLVGYLYHVTHPTAIEQCRDRLYVYREALRYRLTVLQTRKSILSLPETSP